MGEKEQNEMDIQIRDNINNWPDGKPLAFDVSGELWCIDCLAKDLGKYLYMYLSANLPKFVEGETPCSQCSRPCGNDDAAEKAKRISEDLAHPEQLGFPAKPSWITNEPC